MHIASIRVVFVLWSSAVVAACGGGALSPGAGDDPGTGSLTLFVDADVNARAVVANARDGVDFTTEFHVSVEKAGVPVTAGSVQIASRGGVAELVYGSENRWHGSQSGYFEVYELSVVAGEDFVDGVRVDGPALHYFEAPLPGTTVDATLPLEVRWKRGEAADSATLETDQLDTVSITDTGTYTIPVGGLKSKPDDVEQERLRLERSARVTPVGAVAGSSMRVEIRSEIDLLVAPTGL